jgi:CubicO group peptidase (beta-lactamase class C family)
MIPGAAFATFTCETRRFAWDGVARVGESTPIGPHSLYALDAHALPMIATAAVRLERRGVLRLDAPLRELWPSAARRAPWYAHISLVTFLSYQPPIPAFHFGDTASRVPTFKTAGGRSAGYQAARWFLAQEPDSIPSRQSFSFPSAVVAIAILEHVTGKPIAQVLSEEVFAPLALRATFVSRGQYGPNQPRGHFESDEVLRYPFHERLARPAGLYEASELAISLPDYVTFLQAHLCAAQGRPNALLTTPEALRLYGSALDGEQSPISWGALNIPNDPPRIVSIPGTGFSGAGGFSKITGRGALMLLNVDGLYASYASRWVWTHLLGYDEGSMPPTRRQVPRRK